MPFCYRSSMLNAVRTPEVLLPPVWPLPLSLATTRGISVDFFSSGYLDVSVPRVPFFKLWIYLKIHGSSPWGFPHSDTCGSLLICSSPQLFAACRVLLRLLMPRHSPYALSSLNSFFRSFRLRPLLPWLSCYRFSCLSFANNCWVFFFAFGTLSVPWLHCSFPFKQKDLFPLLPCSHTVSARISSFNYLFVFAFSLFSFQ